MSVLNELEPKKVFYYFEEIANIPHGSYNTKQISDYLVAFAKERGLEHYQDEDNNVVIIKEATAGYEDASPIIIQGHMDMVCEKESDCDIDFEKEGLRLYVDGDFVKAKGTTLGGDDGIAVAYALAILDSDDIAHPRLEVVITTEEEVGLLGAASIDLSMLRGHKMLNIDSDMEDYFLTSCAGGMTLTASLPINREQREGLTAKLIITDLEGGHSGAEIHKEHGNANILMGRLLDNVFEEMPFGIIDFAGGSKDNAIPRESIARIIMPEDKKDALTEIVNEYNSTIKAELSVADPNVKVTVEFEGTSVENALDFPSVNRIIIYLRTVPNGVTHMSQVIPGLVETSLNLGILELLEDELRTVTSIRSSVSSRKTDLKNKVLSIVYLLDGTAVIEGDYPAWEYNPNSSLREDVSKIYKKLFNKEPIFDAIHAGLECGILSEKIPNLDCVSFGPNNYDIHTPKERLSISSTKRYYDFLIELLKESK